MTIASTTIPSPIARGSAVAANVIAHPEVRRAAELGIPPDALGVEVGLAALGPDRACFAVTVRVERERFSDAEPRLWYFALRGDPPIRADTPELAGEASTTVRELRSDVPLDQVARFDQTCGLATPGVPATCTAVRRAEFDSALPPVPVRATTQRVCFAHHGTVTARTRRLVLSVTAPSADRESQRLFEWRLEP